MFDTPSVAILSPNQYSVGLINAFLAQDRVSFIRDTTRDIPNGVTIVQEDGQDLSLFHGLKLELRLHEVIGTNHSAKIQLRGRGSSRLLLFTHGHRLSH